jgi:hypothetical protein
VDFRKDGDRRDSDSVRNFVVRCAKDIDNPEEKKWQINVFECNGE